MSSTTKQQTKPTTPHQRVERSVVEGFAPEWYPGVYTPSQFRWGKTNLGLGVGLPHPDLTKYPDLIQQAVVWAGSGPVARTQGIRVLNQGASLIPRPYRDCEALLSDWSSLVLEAWTTTIPLYIMSWLLGQSAYLLSPHTLVAQTSAQLGLLTWGYVLAQHPVKF